MRGWNWGTLALPSDISSIVEPMMWGGITSVRMCVSYGGDFVLLGVYNFCVLRVEKKYHNVFLTMLQMPLFRFHYLLPTGQICM